MSSLPKPPLPALPPPHHTHTHNTHAGLSHHHSLSDLRGGGGGGVQGGVQGGVRNVRSLMAQLNVIP